MLLKITLFLHVLAAVLWIGGMIFLSLVIAPFLKTLPTPAEKSKVFQIVGKRFRLWGWVAIALLLTTGPLALYGLYGITPLRLFDGALYGTPIGHALAFKLFFVILIVSSSLFHDFWLGPKARTIPSFPRIARIIGRGNLFVALLIVLFAVILRLGGF